MWFFFALLSATLLGFYDVCKKHALRANAVVPVLFLNTFFCSLIFLPFVVGSAMGVFGEGDTFFVPHQGWEVHRYIFLKACLVLSSWLLGYLAMKNLPITLVGPINATRPVLVLVGALLIYGEQLNLYQWIGVLLAITGYMLLRRTARKEGVEFRHNRWIYCAVGAAILGAMSGLYDKYLMAPVAAGGVGLNRMVVQSYYNFYQCFLMGVMLLVIWLPKRGEMTCQWRWSILCISLFLSLADFVYFYALSMDGAMISVVSMVRRGSVLISFLLGAAVFHEKNLRGKAIDLLLILLSMLFLYVGTRC
ncbi:MAG: EamA family transporter [Bacteroidaceae bacterium]|nr:EamA family transporter [Bacteroidaceae bacterium]